jgi:hypothetical protein
MTDDPYSPLQKWAKTPTWNTSHALDIERFNRTIRDVYAVLGQQTDIAQIRETIEQYAGDPIWPISEGKRSSTIDSIVERAQAILDYLNDTSRSF